MGILQEQFAAEWRWVGVTWYGHDALSGTVSPEAGAEIVGAGLISHASLATLMKGNMPYLPQATKANTWLERRGRNAGLIEDFAISQFNNYAKHNTLFL
jgi:hypothetical protein